MEVTVRQVQKEAWPRFRMPMELSLVVGGERHGTRVEVSGSESVFEIPLAGRPESVLLDPNGWVLKGGS